MISGVAAFGKPFAHRFAGQSDGVCPVDEAIQDGIGERGIAQVVVPVFHRQLAGDHGGPFPIPIIEKFEQVPPFGIAEGGQPPVVEDEQVDPGQFGQDGSVRSVGPGDGQRREHTGQAKVARGEPVPTGGLREGTGQIALPDPRGTDNQHDLVVPDPLPRHEPQPDAAVEPSGGGPRGGDVGVGDPRGP